MRPGPSLSIGARRYLLVFAAGCAAWAALTYTSFFFNLNSTISDWSSPGITWSYQWFYNFLHGRPFQSSIWAATPGGISVGFTDNAYAYLHGHAIHSNFTPYLFAYLWALHPTIGWLYGIIYAWSLAAGTLLTILILRKLDPEGYKPKAVFATAVLLGSGLSNILDQLAHFLLFAGPVMMAAYYFLLAGRRIAFLATVALLCLVSEDAAMVAIAFGAYIFLFEPGNKGYAAAVFGLAVPYLAFVLLVLQPATRFPLSLVSTTTTAVVVGHTLHLTGPVLAENIKSMLPVFTLLPVIAMGGFLFGWPPKARIPGLLALAVIPALPHWGESVVVGSAHHLLPPFFFTFLALLSMLGTARVSSDAWTDAFRRRGVLAATLVFALLTVRTTAGKLPNAVKPRLYRFLGKTEKAETLERASRGQRESNLAVIAAARAISPESSMSYMANKNISGFIADRSDLWQFPDFSDLVDYIVVQKDATDLIFEFDPASTPDLRGALKKGRYSETRVAPMTPAMTAALRDTFVNKERTHRIALENEHVLVLERIQKHRFYVPPETVGFGWIKNVGNKGAPAGRRL